MTPSKLDPQMYELAKRGARAQLGDLLHEVELLVDLFPHLRDSVDRDELPVNFILKQGRDRADRRAVSDGRRAGRAGRPQTR